MNLPANTSKRTTTVAQAAADGLRHKILSGELAEGDQLKQDVLAREFGISRIPLREALVQLEGEGLVHIVPHKGAMVSELSTAEITELFDLRALLEPQLLKKSAPKLTVSDFAQLNLILSEYSLELHARQPARWGELNTQLHTCLLSRAERPQTLAIVHSLLRQTDRYTRLQLSLSAQNSQQAEDEHAQLVQLCREGDARTAASLLKRHIQHASNALRTYIVQMRRRRFSVIGVSVIDGTRKPASK